MTIGFARRSLALAVGAIAILLTSGAANATPITLNSSQDAWVGASPPFQFTPQPGGLAGFIVHNFADHTFNYGLIQFDLSSLSGVIINDATLSLHHVMNTDTSVIMGVFQNTSVWNANTVSYSNRPTFNAAPVVTKNILSTGVVPGQIGTVETFDVTSLAQLWVSGLAANDGISFMRTNGVNPFLYFAGSGYLGGVDTPQLVINYTAKSVPEPVTVSLIGVGLAGMMVARRRKKK